MAGAGDPGAEDAAAGDAAAGRPSAAAALGAVVEGMMLASYRFDEFRSAAAAERDPAAPDALTDIRLVVPAGLGPAAARTVVDEAAVMANAVALARDLVNRPAGSLTPARLADAAVEALPGGDSGGSVGLPGGGSVEVEVWDRDRLGRENCGGLLGVNAGSAEEPRLVRISYTPAAEPVATVHLVGKGITFDTGGLNLKSFDGMSTMKVDMGGAAAVVGAMSALARLEPRCAVVGICCCTDNQPGPTAVKPGDVLRIRNGTTVEVLNTDAEGRLVLADGLSLAAEAEPDLIVDVATLTGACVTALGGEVAGLMTNSDAALAVVRDAAEHAGEPVWHLPLPAQYRSQLDSDVADLRNIGTGRAAGALLAGLFLQEFVGDRPWAHLDIAGPVTTDKETGEFGKGATGFGVRTLVELVRRW